MRDLLTRRVLLFGGKGGVGKTTCAAATALAARRQGRRVLLVSTDPAHSTADILGVPLGPEPAEVMPGLNAIELDAEHEASRFLTAARTQIATLFSPAVLAEVTRQFELAASMPGVADVALFDRMADLIVNPPAGTDLVVFDTAPTGHTLRLLQMPESLGAWMTALAARRRAMVDGQDLVRGGGASTATADDPVLASIERRQVRLRAVREVLTDAGRSAVVLVLMAERLPIEETSRALETLESAGISVGGIVLNRVLPEGLYGDFYRGRAAQEKRYRDEIARRFAGRVVAVVPQFEFDINRLPDLERVAAHLVGEALREQ